MIRKLLHRWGWLSDCSYFGHDDVEIEEAALRACFECRRCGRGYASGGAIR